MRACKDCGKSIEGSQHRRRYCSPSCRLAGRRRLDNINHKKHAELNRIANPRFCAVCAKQIPSSASRFFGRIYCSPKCKGHYKPEYFQRTKLQHYAWVKKWAKKNPDKLRLYQQRWRRKYPERYRASERKAYYTRKSRHPEIVKLEAKLAGLKYRSSHRLENLARQRRSCKELKRHYIRRLMADSGIRRSQITLEMEQQFRSRILYRRIVPYLEALTQHEKLKHAIKSL